MKTALIKKKHLNSYSAIPNTGNELSYLATCKFDIACINMVGKLTIEEHVFRGALFPDSMKGMRRWQHWIPMIKDDFSLEIFPKSHLIYK